MRRRPQTSDLPPIVVPHLDTDFQVPELVEEPRSRSWPRPQSRFRALADFSGVFAELQPYRQKELMRLVLHKAILGPDCLKLGLYGRPPETRPLTGSEPRFQTLKWLAIQDDLRNYFISEECLRMAELVAAV